MRKLLTISAFILVMPLLGYTVSPTPVAVAPGPAGPAGQSGTPGQTGATGQAGATGHL